MSVPIQHAIICYHYCSIPRTSEPWEPLRAGSSALSIRPQQLVSMSLLLAQKVLKVTFYFPCLKPEIGHFPKKPWFLLAGETKVWVLGMLTAVLPAFSVDKARGCAPPRLCISPLSPAPPPPPTLGSCPPRLVMPFPTASDGLRYAQCCPCLISLF